jgi:hypothetical protein
VANESISQTFPSGRMIMGSLSVPRTKDAEGKPLVIKNGPDMGKPTQEFFFAVAYPKTLGATHWSQEPWGKDIWSLGHGAFPGVAQSPSFSWKIDDGDSTMPNKKGKALGTNPNCKNCWVVFFKQPSPIPCYYYRRIDGQAPSTPFDPKGINAGDYVQVAGFIKSNGSTQNPGVYMNPRMVDLVGYGERITQGADPMSAGFGTAALPAGASVMPTGAMPVGSTPNLPPPYSPPAPNPAILTGVMPPPAPPPPVASGPVMTAKAAGATLESFLAVGWTLDALKANGYVA